MTDVELEEIIVGAGGSFAGEVVDGSLADMLLAGPLPVVDVLVAKTSLADPVLLAGTLFGVTLLADRLSIDILLAWKSQPVAQMPASVGFILRQTEGIILGTVSCRLNVAFVAPETASRQTTDFRFNPMTSMPCYP